MIRNPFGIWKYMHTRRIPATAWQTPAPCVVAIHSLGAKPTRAEVRRVECFLNYLLDSFFPSSGFSATRTADYDLVMTAMWRTVIFHKFGPDHWGFRWAHSWWDTFWPYIREIGFGDVPPPTLEDVFAEVVRALEEGDASAWEEWKRAAAHLFA